ncbi:DUF1127 domain-containing protein [Mesorhizobium xinjiangense]|uniref:DUF1127 domain-containing protein n=1 Tax=Mesorhizobium xinjiangense TaxID=2678685 RepID=UPI0012ECF0E0|nr:DUF1127 domain-containing protein [Mesorhizobium xinjiangense]
MGTIDTIRQDGAAGQYIARRFRSNYLRVVVTRLVSAFIWIDGRMERQRSRRDLMELTDEQLKDIGVSRSEAYRECMRPFWD